MYDGANILHKSYIILHKTAHFVNIFLNRQYFWINNCLCLRYEKALFVMVQGRGHSMNTRWATIAQTAGQILGNREKESECLCFHPSSRHFIHEPCRIMYDSCRIFSPSYIAKLRINTGVASGLCRNV